jgi:hypothetical protein
VPEPHDAMRALVQRSPVLSIHWWEPLLQRFAHDTMPFDALLELEVSEFFAVRSVPSATAVHVPVHVTGRVPVEEEIALPMVEGINAVVWPITARAIHASELLDDYQGVTAVGQWNLFRQRVEWYQPGGGPLPQLAGHVTRVATSDFGIEPCTPLYVYIDELPWHPVMWPWVGQAWSESP